MIIIGIIYHGSSEHNLKKIEPRKSTHGQYVYATREKVLAIHFSKRCGDDLTYDIGHFSSKEGPWELVENIPMALEKMYDNNSSIYSIDDKTFKDIHTGFCEVVSEESVDVINEEYYENLYDEMLNLEKEGLIKIYRYPNKPNRMTKTSILDKYRFYKERLNKVYTKKDFDRLVYLHPEILNEINALAKEFELDYEYNINDLVDLFKNRVDMQIFDSSHEQYIDCAYQNIIDNFPNLKEKLDLEYNKYSESIQNKRTK